MTKKLKATVIKLGRPAIIKSPEERILSNGLLFQQWERIRKDVASSQITPTQKLREIVNWYYAQMDVEVINAELETAAHQDRVDKTRDDIV